MKTYIKTNRILHVLLIVLVVQFLVSCNDKNDETFANTKSSTKEQQIPDGVRTAYYYTEDGTKVTMVDTWKDGKIIHRTVNGHEDTHFTKEHQEFFLGKNSDIDAAQRADDLVKQGWPCVRVIYYGTNLNDDEEYSVQYDALQEDGSCWYDKVEGIK